MPTGGGKGKRRPKRRSAQSSKSGVKSSQGGAKTNKLPADDVCEVMYLRPASPKEKRDKEVSDRFEEIDDLFGDDQDEEAAAPIARRPSSQGSQYSRQTPGKRPTGFSGVTFVEMLVPCGRANCKKCPGTNGSGKKPVAISRPIDEVGADIGTEGMPHDIPSTRTPGQLAGPVPSASDTVSPLGPAKPAAAGQEPSASAPARADVVEYGASPLFRSKGRSEAATRPAAPAHERKETQDRHVEDVREIPKAPAASPPPTPSTIPPPAAREEPPRPTAPVDPNGTGRGPTPWFASDGSAAMSLLEWRGRAEVDADDLEFQSNSVARSERRRSSAPRRAPADKENGSTSDEPVGSRADRLLARAMRLGFRRVSRPSAANEGSPTRPSDRSSYQERRR